MTPARPLRWPERAAARLALARAILADDGATPASVRVALRDLAGVLSAADAPSAVSRRALTALADAAGRAGIG